MTTRTHRAAPLALAALAPIGLAAAAATAQSSQSPWYQNQNQAPFGQRPIGQPQAQRQGQSTFSGRIESLYEVSLPQAPAGHTLVQIQLEDGQSKVVDLGPNVDIDSLNLSQGDQITIRGNQRPMSGEQVLMAHDVNVEGRQHDIARAGQQMGPSAQPVGQPQWRQPDWQRQGRQPGWQQRDPWQQNQATLNGQVQDIRRVNVRGAPPQHTIVQVRLQDGRTELVNLGRQVNLDQLDIRAGDQISLRGEESFIGNTPVISASTLSVGGQQYNLGWFDQPAQPGRRVGWQGRPDQQQVQQVVSNWPQASQQAARQIMQTYGPPHEFTDNVLIWYNNGPWARTIIHTDPAQHNFPMPHEDVIIQTINLDVPPEFFSELAMFDGSIVVDRTRGEISASCDEEAMNFAAINLAYEIVNGGLDVEQARQQMARIARAHQQGQGHPYTQGFQFNVPRGNTGDPGQRVQPNGQSRPFDPFRQR